MRTLLLCIAVTLLNALPALAADLLILQSNRSQAYTEAMRGFHAASRGSERTVVLSDYADVDVERLVKEERSRLVVAVGDKALAAARKIHDVPVVAVLSLTLGHQKQPTDNVGGVTMVAAPQQFLRLFNGMGTKKIGILYDPKKTGPYVRRMMGEARQLGISLVAEAVNDPRELQATLARIKDNVDAICMLPDSTVVTTVNMEAMLLFSITNNLPVVTFSSQYLNNGAAASLDVDYYDVGAQAGEMTASLLNGGARNKVATVDPRKTQLHTNDSVIRKLGIELRR